MARRRKCLLGHHWRLWDRVLLGFVDGGLQSIRRFFFQVAFPSGSSTAIRDVGRVDAIVQFGDLAEEHVPGQEVRIFHLFLVSHHQSQDEERQSKRGQAHNEHDQWGLGI